MRVAHGMRICGVLLALGMLAAVAGAETWYVRAGGDDLAAGTTPATAFQSLRRAAEVFNHGDSMVIGPGVYREAIFLADRFSADGAQMRIDGDESGKRTGDAPGAVVLESPQGLGEPDKDGKRPSLYLGAPSTSVVLNGRPFLAYFNSGKLTMLDISDPRQPRMALQVQQGHVLGGWAYSTISFAKDGSLIAGRQYTLEFSLVPFKGLDAQQNPIYDFTAVKKIGPAVDPLVRKMQHIGALAADTRAGDIYYLAITDTFKKMVPGWGADGTGVGKSTADGHPQWFALSSGGNYMSIGTLNDGKNAWVMAGKSFGGQIDLFDADGLRLTTGNWGWPCHYRIGFVDLRYGIQPYLRPDGKPGAYVEDDAIGRFARCRVDGAETLKKSVQAIDWKATEVAAGPVPDAQSVPGKAISAMPVIPKVAPLPVDGNWAAWQQAGVVPQIVSLPTITFAGNAPADLWQTFHAGTSVGAIAHDGEHCYVYFLTTDDTPQFNAAHPGTMWEFDSVELWMEEEQFGLGFTRDSTPSLFKYRYHNLQGKEWAANYGLPRENVWGQVIDNLASHPLGRLLGEATGSNFAGKKGYAVMGKIPFAEVKLVGGIAGRGGKEILNMTGTPGEVVRLGVAFGGITAWGREQDYQVAWPSGLLFSDPTRSAPFQLGQ